MPLAASAQYCFGVWSEVNWIVNEATHYLSSTSNAPTQNSLALWSDQLFESVLPRLIRRLQVQLLCPSADKLFIQLSCIIHLVHRRGPVDERSKQNMPFWSRGNSGCYSSDSVR